MSFLTLQQEHTCEGKYVPVIRSVPAAGKREPRASWGDGERPRTFTMSLFCSHFLPLLCWSFSNKLSSTSVCIRHQSTEMFSS